MDKRDNDRDVHMDKSHTENTYRNGYNMRAQRHTCKGTSSFTQGDVLCPPWASRCCGPRALLLALVTLGTMCAGTSVYKYVLWPSPSAPPTNVPTEYSKLGHLLFFPSLLNSQRMPTSLWCLSPANPSAACHLTSPRET